MRKAQPTIFRGETFKSVRQLCKQYRLDSGYLYKFSCTLGLNIPEALEALLIKRYKNIANKQMINQFLSQQLPTTKWVKKLK
jgi:hypothetical protein